MAAPTSFALDFPAQSLYAYKKADPIAGLLLLVYFGIIGSFQQIIHRNIMKIRNF